MHQVWPIGINSVEQNVFVYMHVYLGGFPGGSVVDKSPPNAGDTGNAGSIPGLGRSPGEGNGNPLWYSCMENPVDRGAWWATVHNVTKSQTQLSRHAYTCVLGSGWSLVEKVKLLPPGPWTFQANKFAASFLQDLEFMRRLVGLTKRVVR